MTTVKSGIGVVLTSPTEARNTRTLDIDRLGSLEMLRLINEEDASVPATVEATLPELARLVDHAVAALKAGGRVHYVGAGTSGRLGALDAAELIPTYSLEPGRVVAHIAGGERAMLLAVEGAEDDAAAGAAELSDVTGVDVVIGLAASGRTPYVIGALAAARRAGAVTALISANPETPYADSVDIHIGLAAGPEVIAGSTRMKAGTAQKLALNAFSTAVMVRLGRTYSNLMVHVKATNEKLRHRLVSVLMQASGLDEKECETALAVAGGDLKTALVGLLTGCDIETARQSLVDADGVVRDAVVLVVGSADSDRTPDASR